MQYTPHHPRNLDTPSSASATAAKSATSSRVPDTFSSLHVIYNYPRYSISIYALDKGNHIMRASNNIGGHNSRLAPQGTSYCLCGAHFCFNEDTSHSHRRPPPPHCPLWQVTHYFRINSTSVRYVYRRHRWHKLVVDNISHQAAPVNYRGLIEQSATLCLAKLQSFLPLQVPGDYGLTSDLIAGCIDR